MIILTITQVNNYLVATMCQTLFKTHYKYERFLSPNNPMRWITSLWPFTKRKPGWERLKGLPRSLSLNGSQDLNTGSLDAESILFTMLFSLEKNLDTCTSL